MSSIKTTAHGLHYDFRGPVAITTTSHLLTQEAGLAMEFAREMVKSGDTRPPSAIAEDACELVLALNDEFTKRRWRVKTPAVDAEKLAKHYGIEPKESAE